MKTWASEAVLLVKLWQFGCSEADPGEILRALSGAAKILEPCGIAVRAEGVRPLEGTAGICELPPTPEERRPLLRAAARPLRLKELRSLSVFVVPTPPQARYAFSVIDESEGAGCGSPRDPRLWAETGAIFLTDFGLKGDEGFSSLLLAHEIAHELTMKQHPTRARRGSLFADHAADLGPALTRRECECMRQSPFLKP